MMSNLDRYKEDLQSLIATGRQLADAIQAEFCPDRFEAEAEKKIGTKKAKEFIAALPSFAMTYQSWYSEAQVLIRQLLPDRLEDFVRHYEKPKGRKDITFESYRIEDSLQGVTDVFEGIVTLGPEAAIPHFRQQLAILNAVRARFESSLFDIRQLVMADLFDSELDAAEELAKKKFLRGAGAMAGVVLEKHLHQVCSNHSVKISKKAPTISYLNDLLKEADVVDVQKWRFIQHLGDIRNQCDHDKEEPTAEAVNDLIAGVAKTIKTLF